VPGAFLLIADPPKKRCLELSGAQPLGFIELESSRHLFLGRRLQIADSGLLHFERINTVLLLGFAICNLKSAIFNPLNPQ
jgi:hypothetical protein